MEETEFNALLQDSQILRYRRSSEDGSVHTAWTNTVVLVSVNVTQYVRHVVMANLWQTYEMSNTTCIIAKWLIIVRNTSPYLSHHERTNTMTLPFNICSIFVPWTQAMRSCRLLVINQVQFKHRWREGKNNIK